MNSVVIAEALLKFDGAAELAAHCCTGCPSDEAPVRTALKRMFPSATDDELTEGLQLAVSIARLDMAEAVAKAGGG